MNITPKSVFTRFENKIVLIFFLFHLARLKNDFLRGFFWNYFTEFDVFLFSKLPKYSPRPNFDEVFVKQEIGIYSRA